MNEQFVLRAFPETSKDRIVVKALVAIAGFIALMMLWSIIAEVPEVAKTRGEVLPQGGDVQLVQSLGGGKILQVLVKEGDIVEQGQTIASLDQSVTEADIAQLEVKHNDIMMRVERLTALIKARAPNFGSQGEHYPGMASQQMNLYESQKDLFDARIDVLDSDIKTREGEVDSLTLQVQQTEKSLAIVDKELVILKEALERGVIAKQQELEKEERKSELANDLEEIRGRLSSSQSELQTLKEKRESQALEMRTEYRSQRAELVEQLKEVEQELLQAHSAQGQNALVAPSSGIIKSLPNAVPGSVLQPGGVVAELVPSDRPLIAEVRVSPRDIGFIAVGQDVLIKVDAYDYSRFGAMKGKVLRVSPSTFKDERTGQPYFKATIEPETPYVGDASKGRKVKVGMTVEADITTGHKTIFQYLLKPVYTTVDTALSER